MHFPKFLLTALGAAAVVLSAVVTPCGQDSPACQASLKANGRLDKKAPSRDFPFLTSKSSSKFFCSGVLPPSYPSYLLPPPPHESPSLTQASSSEFVVNGTGVPEVGFDLGESYAGRLPISAAPNSTDRLFFWFFPSKNPAASNEITVWLNGGPGCSSMGGLLQENGPFLWQAGTYSPQPNPFSWTNLTNMVWIDQPIGKHFPDLFSSILSENNLWHMSSLSHYVPHNCLRLHSLVQSMGRQLVAVQTCVVYCFFRPTSNS